jgi:ankyrin repeat protein
MTALQSAAINGNSEMLDLLTKAGANVKTSLGGYNGRTALD